MSLPNIYEIAKKAGVSPATVSNVFHNRKNKVSTETIKRVIQIAKEMGYTPDARASSLASRRSQNIGLLYYPNFQQISNVFYSGITEGIVTELSRRKYRLVFTAVSYNDKMPALVRCKDTEGLIVITFIPQHILSVVKQLNIPVVLLAVHKEHKEVDAVMVDNFSTVSMAIAELRRLGHKKIGFITLSSGVAEDFYERTKAFIKEVAKPDSIIKISRKKIKTSHDIYEAGFEKAIEIAEMSSKDRPTAVLCANDQIAIGAMRGFQSKGLSIPEDISVMGIDDIELASHSFPRLTTMHVPRFQMGIMAVDLLFKRIEDPKKPYEICKVKTILTRRDSCLEIKKNV